MKKLLLCFLLYSASCFSQYIPFNPYVYNNSNTGYYFFSSFKINGTSALYKPSLMILDDKGRTVFYRVFNAGNANDFKIAPNKMIQYCVGSTFLLMDSTFRVKDSVLCKNGISTDGHDMQVLSNGHFLIIGYEYRTMNLSSYNWFNGNGTPGSANAQVKCGVVQELDANKNLVWEWKTADHFQFADVEQEWLSSPSDVDWTHCNAVEMDSDGNVILSSRFFSEVTKINKTTGAIMWRLGGKNNQFTFQNDPYSGFHGQHDPRRSSAGKISLFDNGKGGNPIHTARGIEYQLDEVNKIATLVWSYTINSNTVSNSMGSTGKLTNGNYLICGGKLNNTTKPIVSVNPSGEKIFELNFPDTSTSYRAFHYSSLPFTLNKPVVTCYNENGINYLDAGTGYTTYNWSNGATTRRIAITAIDTYYVFVNYGAGMLSSERKVVTNLSSPCNTIGISPQINEHPVEYSLYQNYPNPFNPGTNIQFSILRSEHVILKVYDASGKEIETLLNENKLPGDYIFSFNGSSLPSGVYYYQLSTPNYSDVKKMVLIK
ncbi:MAG: aryl-sulfate sulfotransferase [Ignavibacteria bacterium]|nr:aryl-sulfate sulfotransferase [Ignavibacteria bacterium]